MPVWPVPPVALEKPQDEKGHPWTNDSSARGLMEKLKSGQLWLAGWGQRAEQPNPGMSCPPSTESASLRHLINIDGHWLSSFHVTRVQAPPQRLLGQGTRENRDAALTAL